VHIVFVVAGCMCVQPHARGIGVAAGIQDQCDAVGLVTRETVSHALGRGRAAKDLGECVQREVEALAFI
jgi:hypothetical protein